MKQAKQKEKNGVRVSVTLLLRFSPRGFDGEDITRKLSRVLYFLPSLAPSTPLNDLLARSLCPHLSNPSPCRGPQISSILSYRRVGLGLAHTIKGQQTSIKAGLEAPLTRPGEGLQATLDYLPLPLPPLYTNPFLYLPLRFEF
ncbi:hypothetical protein RRG08_038228 [Elysia crispata]|uniref:Uncharacterized protein n=1 Tax=Elysia crispata TaxID=231223 RepID=A0AAE1AQ40_9GAST|nr:hypothetical protein RRG08_038228 [Elysia crispata]